jgi:zinc transporter ZupT
MKAFLLSISFGCLAALGNVIGGYLMSGQKHLGRFILRMLIGLAAGFMLSATFLEVVPHSFALTGYAPVIILGGYLFVQLVEHTMVSHFHFGEEKHKEAIIRPATAYTAVAGLMLHTFFDGVLIASGFVISAKLGLLMFLAIILHKVPEGFTAASIMRASGSPPAAAQFSALLIALATLLGVISISIFAGIVKYALPFSAGVTLYVAASDLIPEVNQEKGITVSIVVFVGVILYFITDLLLARLQ